VSIIASGLPGCELLLLELLERLGNRGQVADRGEGVAPEDQPDLLLQPQRRRHERGLLGDHRHAAVDGVLGTEAGGQQERGERGEDRGAEGGGAGHGGTS